MKKLLLAAFLVSSFIKAKDIVTPLVDPVVETTNKIAEMATEVANDAVEKIRNKIPEQIEPYKKNGIGSILWTAFLVHLFKKKEIKVIPI